jgi:hypothetical protein
MINYNVHGALSLGLNHPEREIDRSPPFRGESQNVIFDVLMTVRVTMLLFWVVKPFRLMDRYQCFREMHSLHFQP